MPFFFSRRAYNASKKRFSNAVSKPMRYVSVIDTAPGPDGWSGQMRKRDDWLAEVQAAGGDRDVLIYVHGFNTSQHDMLTRAILIENGLRKHGFRGALVSFDWPSDGSVIAYDHDKEDAKKVATSFVKEGLWPIMKMSPRPKVHVLAHSMGAYLIGRALAPFGDGSGPGSKPWRMDQIMFASADLHRNTLAKGASNQLLISHRSKRLTNYYSREDKVLKLSSNIVHGTKARAGRKGIPAQIAKDHVDVSCTAQYRRDAEPIDPGMTYSHRWWFENDGFYEDMALTLAGTPKTAMTTRFTTTGTDYALVT
ncbi:MAG: alpha/beta fold hydrolase [Pseudomonadota bacterium]